MRFRNWIVLFILSLPLYILGQPSQLLIPLQEEAYDFYSYQITAGRISPHFILNQPYRISDLSVKNNSAVGQFFNNYWGYIFQTDKVNPTLIVQEAIKSDGKLLNRYRIDGGLSFTNNFITFANRFTMNQDYKFDKNFAGNLSDADHWVFGRFNDAYMDVYLPRVNIFFGRTARNWGPIGDYSLILSNNPYSFDHLLLALRLKYFQFSLIYAQLDPRNALAKEKKDEPIREIKNARRNLVGYRLDIHFSDNFQMALTQMSTYGGENQPFEWAFLNPMNLNFLIQHNERIKNNGFASLDVFFRPLRKTAIWGQILVDDFVISNDPGIKARELLPDRLGILGSFRLADQILKGSYLSLTYVRIWNRTYQSVLTWENYHYRGYSLGYPSASLEEIKLKYSFWRLFPFYIKNELIIGRYGSVDVTDLFPSKKEPFPVPPVIYNWVNHLRLFYMHSPRVKVFSDIYYRKNLLHYTNRYDEQSKWIVRFGFSYLFNFPFKVE